MNKIIFQYLFLVILITIAIAQVSGTIGCQQNNVQMNITGEKMVGDEIYDLKCNGLGTLQYNLTDNGIPNSADSKFTISQAGKISLDKKLNSDLTYRFNLSVAVISNSPGEPGVTVEVNMLYTYNNSYAPVITGFDNVIRISEDTIFGTSVGNCTLTDGDSVNGTLAGETRVYFQSISRRDSKRWVIDSNTCEIFANTLFDYENLQSYKVGIIAYDLDPYAPRTITHTVSFAISDVNDNYPECIEYYKLEAISEDLAVNSLITTLSCSDKDSGENKRLFYKFSDNNFENTTGHFTINLNFGEIRLDKKVDYETTSFYEVKIDVYDGGIPSLTTTVIIGVVVTDIDDNIPEWPEPNMKRSVNETTKLDTPVFTVTATDRDGNNSITYGLVREPVPNWFDIDPKTGKIVVISAMNWLEAPWVLLELYAYSSDIDHKNVTTVNISIIDINNVKPRFVESVYRGNVSENAQVDTTILEVNAADPENGLNGRVKYFINSEVFKVHEESGIVSLKTKVDFENKTVYSLSIEARDMGTNPGSLSGYAFVLISVLPVNEFTPNITGPPGNLIVREDTHPGIVLFNFTATDDDAGFDGEVTFSIVDPLEPFTIEPKTGLLRVGSKLDRETMSRWDIVVNVRDNSESLPKDASFPVTIVIEDANDNSPICEPLSHTVITLPHVLGTELATINCTDADEGLNAQLRYLKESGDPRNAFEVHETSGIIRLIDYPTETEYTLTLKIEDMGNRTRDVMIMYNIIAELQFNFTNLPATVNITENTVLAYELYDADACCVFGFTEYTLVSGNEKNHVFLDSSSGKLILMNSYDREKEDIFIYEIKAVSIDTNSSTVGFLTIHVIDSNDITPKFNTGFQYISLSETFNVGGEILNATAIDEDLDENGQIVYSINPSSNIGSVFKIDESGTLTLNSSLNAEKTTHYSLEIIATDKGSTARSGSTTIVIRVIDVNEFKPQILNIKDGLVFANVSEDEALNASIFTIRAVDEDVDTIFKYTIYDGNEDERFVIDGSSGDIYLVKLLDREMVDQYNLTIGVSTKEGDNVSAVVVIDVLDVNDQDPKFYLDLYPLEVSHEDPVGTFITNFSISDADIGTNKEIVSLEIISGDNNNHFMTVGTTGIQTNTLINYYNTKLYSLKLKATDGGNPSRSGFTQVVINVLPKFKPPKFNYSAYSVSIREDTSPAKAIFDVDATSNGGIEGDVGNLEYSIRNGNTGNKFYISEFNGTIYLAAELDFESQNQYIILIDAQSRENPVLSASTTLTIDIVNFNEHIPSFSKVFYSFHATENLTISSEVGRVNATDLDGEPFGSITYRLGNAIGATDFTIDTDGIITVRERLDYLRQSVYNIPIIADDGILQGEALAVISVDDVNNNAPTFNPSNVTVRVLESMPKELVFYTAKATDLDPGINGQIEYRLLSSDAKFNLNVSGALAFNTALDREVEDSYDLVIIAVDNATTSALTGTLSLTVNVIDVNDQTPSLSNQLSEVIVNRGDAPGTTVLTVTATDNDIGENAAIEYEITDGNTDDLFLVGVSTGEIITSSSLSAANNEYTLVITAKDKGIPSLSVTMTLSVQIEPPIITGSGEQTMTILENRRTNSEVGIVKLKTGHSPTSFITFSISGGNIGNTFQVDEKSGMISNLEILDREKYPKYNLKIDISDNNNISYTKQVTIDVLDENDNTPKITTLDTDITVVENTPAGQIVTRFTVTDDDIGNNGEVDLKIADTANAIAKKHFEISGVFLKIKEPLDYEATKFVPINIEAVDRGNVSKTSSIQVTVTIIDVQDSGGSTIPSQGEAPSVYLTTETSSSASVGEFVITLTAQNLKLDVTSGPLTFLSVNEEDIFTIDTTGTVTVKTAELLKPEEVYFFWFLASADNATDMLGLLRIDTFNPDLHLVSLESASEYSELKPYKEEFLNSLQKFYPLPDVVKIWKIQEYGTSSRRRLLDVLRSQTLVYVIEAPVPNDIADFKIKKVFKTSRDLEITLRENPDQDIPDPKLATTNYLIQSVNAYKKPESSDSTEAFTSSLEGYVFFALLALLLIILLIILLIFCIYKKKKRQQKRLNESTQSLVSQEETERPSKIDATKFPKRSSKKKFTGATDVDLASVPPTNKTTRRQSQFQDNLLMPDFDGDTGGASTSGKNLQSRFSPMMPPVQEPSLESNMESHNQQRLKPIDKRAILVSQPIPERQASTIDHNEIDNGTGTGMSSSNSPVIARRLDVPQIQRGHKYDAFGYDTDTHQRYAYNTRTGSTLWVERSNNPESDRSVLGGKKKKKATPKLVVSEAKSEFFPNLNMNRSIKIVSSETNN
ncbi:protocadherin Fat 4 [Patella vulgata]|uniref:protocadherin Fat 4 n=1 Tax=Patella vulgata TaxID=6465 RepID=UPI002180008A|nr:protocadherin Fat 4 [Patella vulgata]